MKKNWSNIDNVILNGEVVRDFMRGLEPKGITMKGNHKVILVYNPSELTKMLKLYINLKRSKDKEVTLRRRAVKNATQSMKEVCERK